MTASSIALMLLTLTAPPAAADMPPAQRGMHNLLENEYLPPDFDQQTFDKVWTVWPEPLRSQAEEATPEQRRQMAFDRYGLTPRPNDDSGKPLQYVVDDEGNWTMNCFACHGGQVAGRVVPGLPNSRLALQTLTEDTRKVKARLGKPFSRMDVGSLVMPLGTTNGSTNAVMFGVALIALRDAELNVVAPQQRPEMLHHDMDAPPWWHFKKKRNIYIDGFAPKSHRALMQFMLVPSNGPAKFDDWEDDYRDVYAYLESIEPPKHPFQIDRSLAAEGAKVFRQSCAHCHGEYGKDPYYPERVVPIDVVQTDRARLDALTPTHRQRYGESWFAAGDDEGLLTDPQGYVAPPLDGVWASAPYFHNGSVPTLWHVLHPDQRPVVWKRTATGYDRQRVGLEVAEMSKVPMTLKSFQQIREFYDTRRFGKSAAGHTFVDELTPRQKRAVLEYLKTL